MTQKLIFATNNQHKTEEIRSLLLGGFDIITLKEAGIDIDIPEPYDTLEENAATKAHTIYQLTQTNCFGEDTGLEVAALDGEPGVKSARYAGEGRDFGANVAKLLHNLKDKTDRKAQFRTVIALILEGKEYRFEGVCTGTIITEQRGEAGFGYDPVFVPDDDSRTFAEMDLQEKNKFSHRAKAVQQLIHFLLNRQLPLS